MILGIGTDICHIERVAQYIERFGDRFMQRCFTPDEIAYCCGHNKKSEMFAARIAAKEAACKALGTGFNDGVHWKNFEVASLPSGKPTLRIHGRAAQIASQMGVNNAHVTLTHDAGVAVAFVIFEGE
jgi:holo-[acyl-carrier protein] synthase